MEVRRADLVQNKEYSLQNSKRQTYFSTLKRAKTTNLV